MDNAFEINNNIYDINTNHFYKTNNMSNITNNEEEIEWIIDRRPDIDMTHSFSDFIRNINEDFQLTLTENDNIDEEDFIPFDYTDIQHNNTQSILNETEVRNISITEEERNCPICFETKEREEISQINCGHKFCTNCLTKYIRINNRLPCCPLCRVIIVKITFQTRFYEFYFLDV
jgi:hypothetical protein